MRWGKGPQEGKIKTARSRIRSDSAAESFPIGRQVCGQPCSEEE
jgi:hypothetical protein